MDFSAPTGTAEKGPEPERALVSRRDLIRAALLAAGGSAFAARICFAQAIESGLTAAARGEDGSKFLSDPNWKPAFLNPHQNETLISVGQVIIPSTDTPGAKEALVNRFLDLLLSVESADFQQRFVDALAFIDDESRKRFAKDFVALSSEDQIWLLTPWAYIEASSRWSGASRKPVTLGHQHFAYLKDLIAQAYYGSEIGQKELGWDGEFTHGPYEGCEHESEAHK
jgi:hypothetical protein